MPISQSAKKSLRVSRRKTDLNRARKNLIKETLKKASVKNLAQIISIIDKAVKWRIFHPNKPLVSNLALWLNLLIPARKNRQKKIVLPPKRPQAKNRLLRRALAARRKKEDRSQLVGVISQTLSAQISYR